MMISQQQKKELDRGPPQVRDLKIVILNTNSDSVLETFNGAVYITIPHLVTTEELKVRLVGVIPVPATRILLVYCGSVLEDGALLPEEVFETTIATREDVDIFKPRIHLVLKKEVEVEKKVESLDVEEESAEEIAMREAAEAARLERERLDRERAQMIAHLRMLRDESKKKQFHLETELSHINCSQYFAYLHKAGYEDQVSLYSECVKREEPFDSSHG